MRHRRNGSSWWGRLFLLFVVATLCATIGYGAWLEYRPEPAPPVDRSIVASDEPSASPTIETLPTPTASASPTPDEPDCTTATRPFVPTQVRIGPASYGVQALDQLKTTTPDGTTVLTSPNPTDYNPHVFAWDKQSAEAGSPVGNVLLTAHTYSDGSALGNRLYRELRPGDRLNLVGPNGFVCYKVSERTEVAIKEYPFDHVYDFDGSPRVVITVCSGLRLGPGDWTKRTIWFLEPMK